MRRPPHARIGSRAPGVQVGSASLVAELSSAREAVEFPLRGLEALMQVCAVCQTSVADEVARCPRCGADLRVDSVLARSLSRLRQNPRVSLVRISVADTCCPACASVEGTYPKDKVPALPLETCSGEQGCRCAYAPVLIDIYP